MHAYFPVKWSPYGTDGARGKPVNDGGVLYLVVGDQEEDEKFIKRKVPEGTIILKTSIGEIVDYAIDGFETPYGIDSDGVIPLKAIRAALEGCIAKIDAAMTSESKTHSPGHT